MNACAALLAPEIAFDFFKLVLILCSGGLLLLVFEEVADDLQSGQLLAGRTGCLLTGWLAIHVSLLLRMTSLLQDGPQAVVL